MSTPAEKNPAESAPTASAPATTGPRIITFGCRLNTYESEVMRDQATQAGLTDAIIVNTCAVTKEAERQARQTIRRLRRENPDAKVIVTGCGAQIDPQAWGSMPEVDTVLGNEEKLKAESYKAVVDAFSLGEPAKILVEDIMTVTETAGHLIGGFEGRARAFVQVQQGCDHRCTFCVIPYGRGNSRSVPMGQITEQVRALVANGYGEVVLTGVDITAYGPDLPGAPSLGQMVRRLLAAVPALPRLRLSSLDPVEVDEDLFALIAKDPRLLPHMHLSVQAGADMILKRMKRRHLRDDVITLAKRLRTLRPDMALGADIIVGFPTETEAQFQDTLDLVDEAGLTHLHVFPYSSRPGTPAARMPQVDKATIKDRAKRLRDKGEAVLAAHMTRRVGQLDRVLVEKPGEGHDEGFLPVRVPMDYPAGHILPVRLRAGDGTHLIGEPVS
ncbi:MAG: tRNA (N(6)-L-threonylcarbamoyladenosine(37)-C(2))-methylthiotransferase MtaB [Rhodospirillum sp.]|nr:tRNA (N(6)-L-threonylcarbamoyladenosine(37)-C(2))-methylthiotransferase MtaB [Rhodospirillum sp.]MCF8490727.1 tRNA (N(6)-L-threonylcarbamoyladenosine(37)-C(2))-methylthiotransferase MtaB [Rhodospirillum sp.]